MRQERDFFFSYRYARRALDREFPPESFTFFAMDAVALFFFACGFWVFAQVYSEVAFSLLGTWDNLSLETRPGAVSVYISQVYIFAHGGNRSFHP